MKMRTPRLLAFALLAISCEAATITIDAQPGLAGNAAALAAFQRAAARWGGLLLDDVGVVISGDLQPLGAGTLGQANVQLYGADYATMRAALVADAYDESDDAITAALPTSPPSLGLPANFSYSGLVFGTSANLRALGFALPGVTTDASITFSSGYWFDYDNSDGVAAGAIDFETVATHEIGHALGFVSVVDSIDVNFSSGGSTPLFLMDLFRFGTAVSGEAAFQTEARELRPGQTAYFSDGSQSYLMATGRINGDGRQASHWKDGSLTGVMIPALASEQVVGIGAADLRALDVIGWEVSSVPEPGTWAMAAVGLLAFAGVRRRSA